MMFKIEIKYQILLFSLSTTLWIFFLLGSLSTEYFQTWPALQTLIIVDIIPAILLIPLSYYLLQSVIGHHYIRASLFAAFYASIPLVIYDVIYIAFHLKKGLFFFFDYWYLTIFYFIPWIIIPIIAYKIKRKKINALELN